MGTPARPPFSTCIAATKKRHEDRTGKSAHPTADAFQQIVAEIEAEQSLVSANRELLTRFEQKIQATLARIWGEAP